VRLLGQSWWRLTAPLSIIASANADGFPIGKWRRDQKNPASFACHAESC
jgi:hypothetical protein